VHDEPLRIVPRSEDLDGIAGQLARGRHLGEELTARPPEAELATDVSIELVALLVDGAVVPAAEQGEVREGRRASLGPVTNVMALAELDATAREAAAVVPVVERPP
jgi:hypothetical protein